VDTMKEVRRQDEWGVPPSQWLERHPETCDLLFAIRQAFYPDFHRATAFRARVGVSWLSRAHLPAEREEALRRFKKVEAALHLGVQ